MNKEEKQKTRQDSPESTSCEPKYAGNRKAKRSHAEKGRINMIRLKPAKEVILTPAGKKLKDDQFRGGE